MAKGLSQLALAGVIPMLLIAACSPKEPNKKPVDTTLPDAKGASDVAPAAAPSDISGLPPAPMDEPPAATANMNEFNFKDFPSPRYSGPWVAPDFSGAQKPFRQFRTMISDGVKQGPVFAGSVAVAVFGCGTDCSMGYVADLKSGVVAPLPVGGEANSDLDLEYHPESRLLKAAWKGAAVNYSDAPPDCSGFAYFEWTGRGFRLLKSSQHSPACE